MVWVSLVQSIQREDLLIAIYLVLTSSAWSTTIVGVVRNLSSHGKTFEAISISISVPKKWFLHFYVVGFIYSLAVFVLNGTYSFAALILLIHVSRRCYECLYIHAWRPDSKMHLVAYIVGLVHYVVLPWNFTIPTLPQSCDLPMQVLGAMICLYAQYEQHMHHRLLAKLRREHPSCRYVLPTGRAFEWIGSPQYLAEIVIYIGFLLLLQSKGAAALLLWVTSNQVLNAWWAHEWYLNQFDDYKKQKRKALIPYLF